MKFLDAYKRGERAKVAPSGLKAISGAAFGGGYGYGGNNWLYGGGGSEGVDYSAEAGMRWDNSIVYPILCLLSTTLGGVPIVTQRPGEKGKMTTVQDHPITLLLNKPTPWYDGSLLETTAIFCEGSRGNSYAYKHRSGGRRVVALEILPELTCYPYTQPGSGDWISEYRVVTAMGYKAYPPEDILHLRWMTPCPSWPQLGMSPLESCLPDLVADKLAAKHEASLLSNGAVSSLMASPKMLPKSSGNDVDYQELVDAQAIQLQRRIDERLTGDPKGSSFVWNVPFDFSQIGFDPTQLAMVDTRMISESRLCAVYGVPPIMVQLMVGLKLQNNRASAESAVDQFFDACATPYMRHRGRQFTEDLVPELGEEGDVVCYDESQIPALKARLVRQLIARTGGPVETPNEGRAELGLEPVKGGELLRSPKGALGTANPDADEPRTEDSQGD